jgi:hypothetical protein
MASTDGLPSRHGSDEAAAQRFRTMTVRSNGVPESDRPAPHLTLNHEPAPLFRSTDTAILSIQRVTRPLLAHHVPACTESPL